ncbi:NAD-dependent histone deacetylase HST4 KNAG_0A04690 [Huiozyma naganishii CBS 8797]|uniref:Deacetylase sirtuin-type domain-containing protein n=1 Tax=Huiozyma naganishii (strain ATCC MYA-139 / BCRC 22969 / CBS 8797 / KCTC 17520 / NBRC 10181 / NCYC 3082 / Yp74L-3) TaxID=1071383 RepID=J7S3R6_HUIN7|nr:hypothetical protein KNAG_0A04690 [Kazachstania naganishii CBS 8797]CCK68141.1 hypothetical protein KNAG_0A04690 [Kazachstania naganishii CBS 8797]
MTQRTECTLQLPLTPPSTVQKKRTNCDERGTDIEPRRLLSQLKSKSRRRTPFHCLKKNRIPKNSVLEIGSASKPSESHKLNYLKSVLNDCENIVMITGAGTSTHCGIPDFRSQKNGMYTKCAATKSLFDMNSIYSDTEQIQRFNQLITSLRELSCKSTPTPFHQFINKLAQQGRLRRLYTQNIDSLETKLPSFCDSVQLPSTAPYPVLIQLHGSVHYTQCTKCNHVTRLDPSDFHEGTDNSKPLIPLCKHCAEIERVREIAGLRLTGVGKLRPRITLYNEPHPEGDIIAEIANLDTKTKSVDCLMIVGTKLDIIGVKQICSNFNHNLQKRRQMGKFVVIFISDELPDRKIMDIFGESGIDLIVHGDCQRVPEFA